MALSSKAKLAALLALFVVVGGWVLAGCGSSGPTGISDGPGMLYFYAEW